ncbi:MAG: hypothetical protein KGH94_01650 [Candidatus Micrarchaeota archaeon]|nr:hypothetical protein [Candidatus Micrarchaeota archaeon]
MTQKVFIIGATGKVGREVVKQIVENRDGDPSIHTNPTVIVGLASRRSGALYSSAGIDGSVARWFSEGNMKGKRFSNVRELLRRVRDETVFLDLTAGRQEMLDFHKEVIYHTEHSIVTANKFPLTICDFETFNKLTNSYQRYGFSCSVMAGAGTIHFLRNCPDLNDGVTKIEGCLSGTLTYINSHLENGETFSNIVREARGKYTEPHPADDLDGGDVARKTLILARTASLDVKEADMRVTPFIPHSYLTERNVERFLDRLDSGLDQHLAHRVEVNYRVGKAMRYVGSVSIDGGRPTIRVGMRSVQMEGDLGSLKGTANKVTIWTKMYPEGWTLGPVAGAGNDITARNIRDNLLDLIRGRKARTGR